MQLNVYDIIIINSSAGKDSLCTIYEICRLAKEQDYPLSKISVSHQDLGESEWQGVKELAKIQADLFKLKFYFSKRRNKNGKEETLLEYVERRGMWPSRNERYCTSDFKRGPGSRVVTQLTRNLGRLKVLYVFGFRKDESPFRSKLQVLCENKRLTTKQRIVHDYLPIHTWSTAKVWSVIKENNLPYHSAYDLGMPRLSCVFCVFSPFDALVTAGYANPELLDKYIAVEKQIGHTFKNGFSIAQVKTAIESGYKPNKIDNWIM